jgi:polar amino acid transport system substrate-binding protein
LYLSCPAHKIPDMRSRLFLLVLFALTIILPAISQEAFTISTSYQNLLSNDRKDGLLDRVIAEAFRRIGMEVEFVYTPTARSLADVNAGLFDAEINRVAGMETQYPDLRRVSEPNMVMDFVAFSTRDIPIDGWESLRDLDIGTVKGWKILETNTEGYPGVVKVPTEIELFRMLSRGRLDVALYDLLTGYAVLDDLGLQNIAHLEPPLASMEMYLYVHRKHEGILPAIAGSLRAMKADGTYDRIVAEVLDANAIPSR